MTPEQLAKSGSEDGHQAALFAAINGWIYKNRVWNAEVAEQLSWVHAIPNGGHRHKAVAGRMKMTGAKPGVFDIFCPVPRMTDRLYSFQTLFAGAHGFYMHDGKIYEAYHGLYVEMKKPDEKPKRAGSKGGLSDEQIEFQLFVGVQGYGHIVCYSWQEAYVAILTYLGVQNATP